MKVRWTASARQDRIGIRDYIAIDNPGAASHMDAFFSEAAARLADYPHLGRPGQISGTQELIPHQSYRLVYEVSGETVWILALVHTARLWPPARE